MFRGSGSFGRIARGVFSQKASEIGFGTRNIASAKGHFPSLGRPFRCSGNVVGPVYARKLVCCKQSQNAVRRPV